MLRRSKGKTGRAELRNISAAAAVTERVQIVPSLYVLPMHSAVRAAKEIATLDVVSEGRVTVTVGVGGREKDYEAVGASFKKRHQRMDDQVAQMRAVWAGEPPVDGADPVGPRPIQEGGPKILAGSMGPKAIARASKWADGLFGFAMNGESELTRHFKVTAESAWQESGRDNKPYFVGGFWYSLAPNAEHQLKDYVFKYMRIFGDKEARSLADTMSRFNKDAVKVALDGMEELGVDELYPSPATAEVQEIDAIAEILATR